MARAPQPEKLAAIEASRTDGEYTILIKDEGGKGAGYLLSSDQALQLADKLDDLLADEEAEQDYSSAA